jgi:hypothetical protein
MEQNKSALPQNDNDFNSVEDRVFEFLEMSQKILALVKHENIILEKCGCLSLESYLEHRDALLRNYEQNARFLIEHSVADAKDSTTRLLLASELSAVRAALSDNTTYQFESLKNKISLTKGEKSWH